MNSVMSRIRAPRRDLRRLRMGFRENIRSERDADGAFFLSYIPLRSANPKSTP
jgi:hypothetical protein